MKGLVPTRYAVLLAVFLLLIDFGSARLRGPAEATFSGATGRLAFTMGDDIYVSDSDGHNAVNITNHPAEDFDPAWSPDGTKIVFTSERDGNREIYVMNDDGSAPTRLTNDTSALDFSPAWSPDGATILYRSSGDLLTIPPIGGTPGTAAARDRGNGAGLLAKRDEGPLLRPHHFR